jgi:tetratricopeptide (TPR) repeat protein/energy-coupling factor transporter ATP-binding protein EcfA2
MVAFQSHERPAKSAAELPVTPPTRLVGREAALQQIYPPLKEARAVFLHGPEGVGKTAIASTLAAAFAQQPGGVLWLNTDAHTTLENLLVRIGRAYNVAEIALSDNPLGMVAAVATLLQQSKPLVVLDGTLDIPTVARFVTRCADRVPVLLVDRNTQDGPWVSVGIEPLSPDAAATMFKQEANLTGAAAADKEADIKAVVKALNHLPFAIGIAARTMLAGKQQPADLNAKLRQVAPSINNDPAKLALTISFAALNSALQGVLLMMGAVQSGAATAELLSMVSGAPVEQINQAVQMLSGLRLVERTTRAGQPYFRLHPLTQRYAEERLQASGRLDGLREKVREKLVEYAQHYRDGSAPDKLAAEMDNFVALARHAQQHGDRDISSKLVIALSQAGSFVTDRGFVYDLMQIRGTPSAPFPAHPPEPAPPKSLFDSLASDLDEVEEEFDEEEIEAAARGTTTATARAVDPLIEEDDDDDFDEDEEEEDEDVITVSPAASPEDTLSAFASNRFPAEPVAPEDALAAAGVDEDDDFDDDDLSEDSEELGPITPAEPQTIEEKIASLRIQVGQARQDGDTAKQVATLRQLGHWEVEQGLLIEAIATYNQALSAYEARDDQEGQLETLEILSALMEKTENAQAAVLMAQRGAKLAEVLDDEETELQLLLTLGDARQQLGESIEAARAYSQALEIARNSDDSTHEAIILHKLGYAQLDSGDTERAVDTWEQALALFNAQERRADEGRVKGALGSAYAELQRWPEAINFHKSALYIAREMEDKAEEAVQLSNLGYTSVQAGQLGEAMTHYRQALHLAYESGDRANIVATLVDLVRLIMKSPAHLKIAELLVDDGLRRDGTDKDLRALKERIASEMQAAAERGVQFKPANGTAEQYAEKAYSLA